MPNFDINTTTGWFKIQPDEVVGSDATKRIGLMEKKFPNKTTGATKITLQGIPAVAAHAAAATDQRSSINQRILSGLEERMKFPGNQEFSNASYWM
jgi:hypothetical protein